MTLYLYKIGTTVPVLTLKDVMSYTNQRVTAADGTVYAPLAGDCELSLTADCTGTLRADWQAENPTSESRIEEMEMLLAGLLFGGEAI